MFQCLRAPAIVVFAVMFSSCCAFAADDGRIMLYSNICLHGESGDLLGTRLGFLHLADGSYAFYQEVEGWPNKTQMVKLEPEQFQKSRFSFRVDTGDKVLTEVEGRVVEGAALLSSGGLRNHNEKILRLKRVSFPEKVPACR